MLVMPHGSGDDYYCSSHPNDLIHRGVPIAMFDYRELHLLPWEMQAVKAGTNLPIYIVGFQAPRSTDWMTLGIDSPDPQRLSSWRIMEAIQE